MPHCSLAQFENAILSSNGKYIVFRVKRRYKRFLLHWALQRFGAGFPPTVTLQESLDDSSYTDFRFYQGTVQEQMSTHPIDYMNVSFSWLELLPHTFSSIK